jgi:hypothetical protein
VLDERFPEKNQIKRGGLYINVDEVCPSGSRMHKTAGIRISHFYHRFGSEVVCSPTR